MAPPGPPLWGGCHARPAAGVSQGGARSDATGGDGALLPVYRGAVWPGRAIQAVPWGRRVWLPPPSGAAVTRAPLEELARG